MIKNKIFLTSFLFIQIIIFVFSNTYLQDKSSLSGDSVYCSSTTVTIPPILTRALATEFEGLFADLVDLQIGAMLGTELVLTKEKKWAVVKKKHNWDKIVKLFEISMYLDPYFQHTYMLAQGWLPWDAKKIEETMDILNNAKKHRTWDWRPSHLMGFNTYYFMKNPGEAGKILLEAANIPNAPPFLAILGARLACKGESVEAAIPLMESMITQKDPSDPGYQDIKERLKALKGVYVIEQAIKNYEQNNGKKPSTLNELVTSGVLLQLPPNPYNLEYCIDKEGKVYFDKPNC